jgi:hypothetical protein
MTMLGAAPREPTPDLIRTIETYFAAKVVGWQKPHTGLTAAQRFVARFADGSSAFVKAAVDADTERWLRTDHLIMSTIDCDLVPRVIAWIEAGEQSVLVIEDLTDAHWPADHFREESGKRLPVLWKPGQFQLVFRALDRLAAVAAPRPLPPLSTDLSAEWAAIAANPASFLALVSAPRHGSIGRSTVWWRLSVASISRARRSFTMTSGATTSACVMIA